MLPSFGPRGRMPDTCSSAAMEIADRGVKIAEGHVCLFRDEDFLCEAQRLRSSFPPYSKPVSRPSILAVECPNCLYRGVFGSGLSCVLDNLGPISKRGRPGWLCASRWRIPDRGASHLHVPPLEPGTFCAPGGLFVATTKQRPTQSSLDVQTTRPMGFQESRGRVLRSGATRFSLCTMVSNAIIQPQRRRIEEC